MPSKRQFTPGLISMIVPVYNAERWLEACLDSIAAQTWRDLQIILVDDGSTDGSFAICKRYAAADARFEVIAQQNAGPGAARNAGMRRLRGEYFGFVDSDDTIAPDFCAKLANAMRREDADIAVCDYEKNGAPEGKWAAGTFEGAAMFAELAEGRLFNRIMNKLYRSERLAGLAFPVGRDYMEDGPWTAEALALARRIVRIEDADYRYRVTPGSLTQVRVKPARAMCAAYVNLIERDRVILEHLGPADAEALRRIARECADWLNNMLESYFDPQAYGAWEPARAFARRYADALAPYLAPDDVRMMKRIAAAEDFRSVVRRQRCRALFSPRVPLRRKARLLFRLKNRLTHADGT